MKGHYASIDALLLVPFKSGQKELLVSGSRDRSVGLWDPSVMLEAQTSAATAGQPSKTSGLLQKIDVHKVGRTTNSPLLLYISSISAQKISP